MADPERPAGAVLLVDHGSRSETANRQLEALAAAIRERLPGRHVAIAHLELAPPTLAEGLDGCLAAGAREIVVHPYFLAPGRHGSRDVPEQVARWAASHPQVAVRVTEPLGLHPSVVDAVLARISEG